MEQQNYRSNLDLSLSRDHDRTRERREKSRRNQVPHKATGTGTPTQWLQHEKQHALRLNVSHFCSRKPSLRLRRFLPSLPWMMEGGSEQTALPSLRHPFPSLPSALGSKRGWIFTGREACREAPPQPKLATRGEAPKAERPARPRRPAGPRSAARRAGVSRAGGAELPPPPAARAAVATCCWKRGPGAGRPGPPEARPAAARGGSRARRGEAAAEASLRGEVCGRG